MFFTKSKVIVGVKVILYQSGSIVRNGEEDAYADWKFNKTTL